MKKTLLSVLAFATVAVVNAQSSRVRGVKKYERKNMPATEASGVSLQAGPQTQIPHVRSTRGMVTPLGTYAPTVFAGSVNAFGSSANSTNTLDASNTLGIVSFTNRIAKWGTSFNPSSANSGWIYTKWSSNFGQTWDSTFIRSEDAGNANLSRYPSGCILNPSGNTAGVAGAFIAGAGPFTTGAWDGNWFANSPIVSGWSGGVFTPSNTNLDKTNFTDNEANQYFASSTMGSTANWVYSAGAIIPGLNNSDYLTTGIRVNTASYDANLQKVVWDYDSVNIDFVYNSTNTQSECTIDPVIAFNEEGTVGYVLMSGVETGTSGANYGYVPVIFQSFDGGDSWTRIAQSFDWSTTQLQDLLPNANNLAYAKPFFSTTEGADAVVDAAGNLHMFTVIDAGSSSDVDSLGYTFGMTGYAGLMFDAVWQKFEQSWCVRLVDTLYSGYASGTAGNSCNTENVWITSGGKIQENSRLQMSRTEDGSKVFFIWTDTDTSIANFCNVYPDIYVKAFDIGTQKYTKTYTISQGDQSAYHMYASDKVLSSGGNHKLALTITKNSTTNADINQYIYFINNAIINEAAFTEEHLLSSYLAANSITEKCVPVGYKENNISKNIAVNASPNPFTASTNLSVRLTNAGNITVNVYNNLGSLVSKKSVTGNEGVNTISIDGANWSNGIYFYNVTAGNETVKGKVILNK